jgi:hypothetical protein
MTPKAMLTNGATYFRWYSMSRLGLADDTWFFLSFLNAILMISRNRWCKDSANQAKNQISFDISDAAYLRPKVKDNKFQRTILAKYYFFLYLRNHERINKVQLNSKPIK